MLPTPTILYYVITFLKTRHNYESYADFWQLVELSCYPVQYVDEANYHDKHITYIITPMSGEFEAALYESKGSSSTIYHWNLERPCDGTVQEFIEANERFDGLVDLTIVSDRALANQTGFHYVPIGGHEDFGAVGEEKIYHFAPMMCYNYRRSKTKLFRHTTLKEDYNGMKIAPNCWGDERDKVLKATKFMLSLHQDDHKFIEPLRYVLATSYGLPILAEQVTDSFPYTVVEFNELKGLQRAMKDVLDNYSHWQQIGLEMRTLLTGELSFRNCIERYL